MRHVSDEKEFLKKLNESKELNHEYWKDKLREVEERVLKDSRQELETRDSTISLLQVRRNGVTTRRLIEPQS